jgi:succinyl-diaminopimelate desuccinylase
MKSPTLALAEALIARRSVTPDDAGCQDLIAARLKALGDQRLAAGILGGLRAARDQRFEQRQRR